MRLLEPEQLGAKNNWIINAPNDCGELTFVWVPDKEELEITFIEIEEKCRRKGYGRLLIKSCEKFAYERDVKRIAVLVIPRFTTLSYFVRMKYVPVRDKDKEVIEEVIKLRTEDARLYDTVSMEKYMY